KKKVNKYTPVQFDSSYPKQTAALYDSTSESGFPSIAHYIKKAFLVSDNDAYNRLYEFIGQQGFNKTLREKGYYNIRITRQFRGFTAEQNRVTNQVRFIKEDGRLIYLQPPAYNTDSFHFPSVIKLGKAYYNSNDSLINEPMNFTEHNYISLEDFQQILQSVMLPTSVPASQRFNISKDDRKFLLQFLSQYPSETNYPKYDTSKYYDSYVKFFFKNESHRVPDGIRIFNKVGWSYGFLTDASYIVDFKNKLEFMLSATLYVNSDGILNDDRYEYDQTGYPFLYQLGQIIYHYELQRKRTYLPDLSDFRIKYEKRKEDARKSLREINN
ncbi:MAG TPA: serine hydrolase, partial [Ferruginibacter sp.]|nr:serine hydrolase [Ferruginibacter sp.]